MINKDLITLIDSEDPASESYRALRTNILMRQFEKPMQVINVISTSAQEGKSTTILNLAVVFAQLGKKVLVIDLDLRLPSIHKKLKIKNQKGVTVLFGDVVISYAQNLDVLTSGTKIPYAAEFVQSQTLQDFINSLRKHYDIILLDCPPVGLVTDGVIISNYCDGTLLVIASGHNDKKDLLRTKDLLDQMKTNVIGIVMSMMPVGKNIPVMALSHLRRKGRVCAWVATMGNLLR